MNLDKIKQIEERFWQRDDELNGEKKTALGIRKIHQIYVLKDANLRQALIQAYQEGMRDKLQSARNLINDIENYTPSSELEARTYKVTMAEQALAQAHQEGIRAAQQRLLDHVETDGSEAQQSVLTQAVQVLEVPPLTRE